MAKKMSKREENLLAKIAAQLGTNLDEIKEAAQPLYTAEATILEAQSIYNFYLARIRPEQGVKESKTDFERRYREWQFKICRRCDREFAYAYHYEGVSFCSLECVDAQLKSIGMELTRGRDVRLRWGQKHPAIVNADALETLRSVYPDSLGTSDVPFESALPKFQPAHQNSILGTQT